MIFGSLIGIIILPFILIWHPEVFNLSFTQAIIIMSSGLLVNLGWLAYLYALEEDEASIVSSLFQTIPIFLYFFAFIFIGEKLSIQQIIASLLIILGGITITWDFNRKKFKARVFLLMLLASALIAAEGVVFKIFALQTDFWTTAFWEYIGGILTGLLFLILVTKYRQKFFQLWKNLKFSLISINVFNEIINVLGILSFRYAMLLAPLALVQSVNGFQPVFGVLMGIALTLFFPRLGKENILKKNLLQKAIAVFIMLIGAYLIERGS